MEKRGYRRYCVPGSVVLKLPGATPRSINADLVDLSFLGVCVFSPEKIEPGTEIEFSLQLSFRSMPMTGKGKVKYAMETASGAGTRFRTGIDFTQTDKRSLASMLGYIATDFRKREQQKKPVSGNPEA